MTDKEGLFLEETLLNSVKKLLTGQVNELLGETGQSGFTGLSTEFWQSQNSSIPPIEFGTYRGGSVVSPAIALSTCERTEKERIVRLDTYTLTITFTVPEHPAGERNCYAYAASVAAALGENPTLGGVVDRAELAGKKYSPPKERRTGGEWGLTLTLRLVVEGAGL